MLRRRSVGKLTVFSKDGELIGVYAKGGRITRSVIQKKSDSFEPYGIYKIGFVSVEHLRNLVKRMENGEILTTIE